MEVHSSNRTSRKVALTAAIIACNVGLLTLPPCDNRSRYYMVDELLAGDLTSWEGKELRVHGYVEAGTIVEKLVDDDDHYTFVLNKGGKRIRVFWTGVKPDHFKDGSEVVVSGELVKSAQLAELAGQLHVPLEPDMPYMLDSNNELITKCVGKYDGTRR
jgi:cytochrome c-type biogenesis protein CcmE